MGKRAYKQPTGQFFRHIGERVRHYRISKRNLTQEDLAEQVDSNSSYISKVENGQAQGLTIAMLKVIADSLEVNIADLVDEDLETGPSRTRKRARRLVARALALPWRTQTLACDLFEGMLDKLDKTHRRE